MQQGSRKKNTTRRAQTGAGLVRIIGGRHRGRKLRFAAVNGLRPTLDRIRETLFNWLQAEIGGAKCLDLFAGSGALGFEAASRGAAQVTLVEANAKVAGDLRRNADLFGEAQLKVVNRDAAQFLKQNTELFDLIFLDPPFHQNLLAPTLAALSPHLKPQGLIYVEQETGASAIAPGEAWRRLKHKATSQFSYALYSHHPASER